jgi:hypothetical protein
MAIMASAQPMTLLRGSNVVALTDGMSEQERADILDCLMYAQIKASERADSHTGWFTWINRYHGALLKAGLTFSGVLASQTRSISDKRELPFLASSLIESYGHQALGDLARSSLDALLKSRTANTFFQEWFVKDRTENLQLVPCLKASNGQIEIMVCAMRLITESTEGSWFERPTSTMIINVEGGAFLYDQNAFGAVREKLRARLDRHAAEYFDSLTIQRI